MAQKLLKRFEYRDESKTSGDLAVDSKGIDGVYSTVEYSTEW